MANEGVSLAVLLAVVVVSASAALPQLATRDGRFIVAQSGKLFEPRGQNYIRLNGTQDFTPGAPGVYHSTFSPRLANASEDRAALRTMASYGYNVARVFLDNGDEERTDGINGDGSAPLSAPYLDNLAVFARSAASLGIYTMATLTALPSNSYFAGLTPAGRYPNMAGTNSYYLNPDYVAAKAQYAGLLAQALKDRLGSETTCLFGFSLENEAAYALNALPFSSNTIQVTTADNRTYDMSNATERQACADSNMLLWTRSAATAAQAHLPALPVSVGMFTFQAVGKAGPNGLIYPHPSDIRYPFRPWVLLHASRAASGMDFVDVHVYPVGSIKAWSLQSDLGSSELVSGGGPGQGAPALFLGETGAFTKFFSDAPSAAEYFSTLFPETCAYGFSGMFLFGCMSLFGSSKPCY